LVVVRPDKGSTTAATVAAAIATSKSATRIASTAQREIPDAFGLGALGVSLTFLDYLRLLGNQ
jgi:hypothetical protein